MFTQFAYSVLTIPTVWDERGREWHGGQGTQMDEQVGTETSNKWFTSI